MNTHSTNKKFVFISDSDRESATSRLRVSGIPYIKKRLESNPENWEKIVEILRSEPLLGILLKLSNQTLMRMTHPRYRTVCSELLTEVSRHPHIGFVHSSFFGLPLDSRPTASGDDEDPWFGIGTFHAELDNEIKEKVTDLISEHEINIVPYRRNVELSVLASEFIDSHQNNLIFRFYVPTGKIWAGQTEEILGLFRDYLNNALKLNVRQNSHNTAQGTIYEFFGDGELSKEAVAEKFLDFTQIMDLCITDPDGAERILITQGASADEVARIVTTYTKKLRRITSDMRHEREQKILTIRHRMENELLEVASDSDLEVIRRLVDQVLPDKIGVSAAFGLGAARLEGTETKAIMLNFKPQFINQMNGIVAQELHGDQHIGPEPSQILDLIQRAGGKNTNDLKSAVYELEDSGTEPEKRLSAGRRLQAFLGKVGDKAVDAGIGILQAYIQNKIGIGT